MFKKVGDTIKRASVMLLILVLTISISFALPNDSNNKIDFSYPTEPTNYSTVNTNNSNFLQGYTPQGVANLSGWFHDIASHILYTIDGLDKVCIGTASQCAGATHLLSIFGGANITGNLVMDNVGVANSVTRNLEITNNVSAQYFKGNFSGNGSGLTGVWTAIGSQTGLTDTKSGSYNINTTGNITVWGKGINDGLKVNGSLIVTKINGVGSQSGSSVSIAGGDGTADDGESSYDGGSFTFDGGNGGTTSTATLSGGGGGGLSFRGGVGGTGSGSAASSGGGGSLLIIPGAGGISNTNNIPAGSSGSFSVSGTLGGSATGSGSGTNTGGTGSSCSFVGGTGGSALNNAVKNKAGAGGAISFTAGNGGTGTGGTEAVGGAGGAFSGTAGNGQSTTTAGVIDKGANGGSVTFTSGSGGNGINAETTTGLLARQGGNAGTMSFIGANGGTGKTTGTGWSRGGVGTQMQMNPGNGGAGISNGANPAIGGVGAGFTINTAGQNGAGGASTTTSTSSNTGGVGFLFQLTAGVGGQATNGINNTGGDSGSIEFYSNNGGAATSKTNGNATGGNTGVIRFGQHPISGTVAGGAVTGAGRVNRGGSGGDILFYGANGGTASGATTNNGGNGSNIRFYAGSGGVGTQTTGTNGNIHFYSGTTEIARFDNTGSPVGYFLLPTANQKLQFTTASSCYYNTTDLLCNPKDTGTGKFFILGDANIQNKLTASNLTVSDNMTVNNLVITGNMSAKRPYFTGYDNSTQPNCGTTCANIINLTNNADYDAWLINVTYRQNLTFQQTGDYICTLSPEFYEPLGQSGVISFWIEKNGVDAAWSNSRYTLSSNTYSAPSITYQFDIHNPTTDIIRFKWYSDNANTILYSSGVLTTPSRPSIPSVLINCQKISEVTP